MKLDSLEQHWNALGHDDPLWAILSLPGKRGGVWDLEEFLATGRRDVEQVLAQLRETGIDVARGRALDFGCGIGRLTQPLADHFQRCDGVDLAGSMIEQAVRLNQREGSCHFHHSSVSDLRMFTDESFDFVISLLVFQHMEPGLMRGYLREVVRVLKPDGVAYFNLPDRVRLGTEIPPHARRARLQLSGELPVLAPAEVHEVGLEVRNDSGVDWPLEAQLVVGNHWLSAGGDLLVGDDGRTPVDAAVPPGSRHRVTLTVHAPSDPGDYLLEVDLLQEHRGWFATSGSETLRLPVSVVATGASSAAVAPAPTAASPLVPRIEMHVLSREDAVQTIEAAGGVVLDIIAKDRCGPETPSFDYIVARAPAAGGTKHGSAAPPPARPLELPIPAPPRAEVLAARALLDRRADLISFELSSRLGRLGWLSTASRRLLRRALLEVVFRQTEFNQSGTTLIHELERQVEHLHSELEARDAVIADARRRIASLEARAGRSDPPGP
ncbi:MAG TPA: methyltransferase domain-containing protein [Solirubrobacteraceae bacterium]|nr:methyltransferase domain-containing protein [Solirubrobacteraceae bacterium]